MMEGKYNDKYRIRSTRLENWDYGSHGLYFVTICTKDRVPYFGEILPHKIDGEDAFLKSSAIGDIALNNWLTLPNFRKYVELDAFVIMPDHIHAILFINKPDKESWNLNKFGPQKENLAAIIRGFKASVKRDAIQHGIPFEWQSRYFDRVIRNDRELQNIRNYIFNNPDNWLAANDNLENLIIT